MTKKKISLEAVKALREQTSASINDVRVALEAADGEATLCAIMVATDDETGLALRIAPLRIGGRLSQELPDI